MNINTKQRIADIVTQFPKTTEIMHQYKMDYCCGGRRTLGEVIATENGGMLKAKESEILDKLEQASKESINIAEKTSREWFNAPSRELIDHIVNRHHVWTFQTLKTLNELTPKILRAHYTHGAETLLTVHRLFGMIKLELEAHLIKEEVNLFPMITKYEETKDSQLLEEIQHFILDTEHEHDAAGDLIKELDGLTDNFTPPEWGCLSVKKTWELLDALQKDLFQHIHLENSILFERYTD